MNFQSRSRPLILCIDEEGTTVELSIRKRLLETAGYRVLTTTNGQTAFEMFRDDNVDLVLTEQIATPLPNNFTLAAMKRLKPKVPIAIYSADWEASPEHLRFADTFMTKLTPIPQFLRVIESLLSQGGTARAA